MLHPIFSAVLGHPALVVAHLANYGSLLREEAAEAGRGLVARAVAGVLAAVSAMLALGLTGMAVMLGVLDGRFHWVLVIVPGVAIVVALVAAFVAARPFEFHGFSELRMQVDADVRALHLAGRHDGP